MRRIYSTIYALLMPFIMLRLLWRSLKAPAYRKRMKERLALFQAPSQATDLWVHAVSMGEVIAAIPLIKLYQQQNPQSLVTVTTMTPTGSERVKQVFGDTVFHVYLPYDLVSIVSRFIRKVNPKRLVIIETELWPNLLYTVHKHNIPILLANARLSQRSADNYAKVRYLTKKMLNNISLIAVQTQAEANRYIDLGMPESRIEVTGSVKFDITISEDVIQQGKALRQQLSQHRPVLIAASTHNGEEEQVLQAFEHIIKVIPDCLLMLVPRHPERFTPVVSLCQKQGYKVRRRTDNQACDDSIQVFVGDTMGELLVFYAASDVAFVGGSLVPVGGHNLLEPAALEKATITGPHMHNFLEITRMLLQEHGLKQINAVEQLAQVAIELLNDPKQRAELGENANSVVKQNRGALQKHMEFIAGL